MVVEIDARSPTFRRVVGSGKRDLFHAKVESEKSSSQLVVDYSQIIVDLPSISAEPEKDRKTATVHVGVPTSGGET